MASSAIAETPQLMRPRKGQSPAPGSNNNSMRLILGLLLAVFLVVGLFRMFAKPAAPSTVMIVAAAKDLPPGVKVGYRDLHYMNVPRAYFTNDLVQSYPEIVGSCTSTFISMGEPLRHSEFFPGKTTLESQLTAAQRALTLHLNDDTLVDHMIQSGDKVDLVATTAGPNGKKYTKTICQNIDVLMAAPKSIILSDKWRGNEQNKLTIAVTPADAEKVSQALETSKIRVILRNRQVHTIAQLQGADERDLLPHDALRVEPPVVNLKDDSAHLLPPPALPTAPAISPAPPPAPLQWVVDVFKGATKETQAVGGN